MYFLLNFSITISSANGTSDDMSIPIIFPSHILVSASSLNLLSVVFFSANLFKEL